MDTDRRAASPEHGSSPINIELLAIDLKSCTRCVGTLDNIDLAIEHIQPILKLLGREVNVRRILVESEEQARQHRFLASPTVRINGRDIVFDTAESHCDSCSQLCGCDTGTQCRVWRYRGEEFTEAPVGLLVESLLREITGSPRLADPAESYDDVPLNLKQFFSQKRNSTDQACCPAEEQETCCDAEVKSTCCNPASPQHCAC